MARLKTHVLSLPSAARLCVPLSAEHSRFGVGCAALSFFEGAFAYQTNYVAVIAQNLFLALAL